MLKYAGIGSRKTPDDVLSMMVQIGENLADASWYLNTGFADGADKAFAYGAEHYGEEHGLMTNYLPWAGYNDAPLNDDRFKVMPASGLATGLAEHFHPAWDKCSIQAKLLHIRNGYIVLGDDLRSPVDMVVCWTEGGITTGGTGQALRIAQTNDIPIFNLFFTDHQKALCDFVDMMRERHANRTTMDN